VLGTRRSRCRGGRCWRGTCASRTWTLPACAEPAARSDGHQCDSAQRVGLRRGRALADGSGRRGSHHDATLECRTVAGARRASLQVEIACARKASGTACVSTNPRPPSPRLDLRADLAIARKGEVWQASGTLYVETGRADLERMRAHLPVPEALRTAVGSFRAWVDFEPGTIREVTADMNLRGVRAQLAADALPLDLEALSGRAFYRLREGGFAAGTRGLAFRTRAKGSRRGRRISPCRRGARPGRRRAARSAPTGRPEDRRQRSSTTCPCRARRKAQANLFAPRGALLDSSLVWTGESLATAKASA